MFFWISSGVLPAVVQGTSTWRQLGWMLSQVLAKVSGPAGSIFPNAAARGGKSGSVPLREYTRPSYGAHRAQVVPWLDIMYRSCSWSAVRTASTSACLEVVRDTIVQ